MAQAKQCDRCGVLYKPYNNQIGEYNSVCRLRVDEDGNIIHYSIKRELCRDCMSEFISFMRNEPTEITITVN